MKLVKFEKENCGPCNMVSNWLEDQGVEYERVNPFKGEEAQKLAVKYKIGMTVPVTVLVDDAGEKVELVRGFNPDELETLVAKLKA
jgi:thioredoxin 1